MASRSTWNQRPPVVVVCPNCDSGIYQHRSNHPFDCNECSFYDDDSDPNEYEIVRFDCPDCGANITENWSTRDLTGRDDPDLIIHVWCDECGMDWEPNHW